jgi:hypothetical protein
VVNAGDGNSEEGVMDQRQATPRSRELTERKLEQVSGGGTLGGTVKAAYDAKVVKK